ncbi:glycosyltransferase [Adonisia turfae]|uniref:Glycosyltransferase family 2 protein n=1 Tax=Adonisia turfae CCMR0081 TaxID=2292702 RepID=A0A6M0RKH9_9CYAN|nr:glycosyltransferase family A protein [Adonisia turfae]NEZ56151.1 glycosyltransferase family 2 protein [Adonisia turfae CCMR0081]
MTAKLAQTPFVSIIIPVYNSNKFLGNCLAALSKQTYAKDRYEIIVVDNNSTETVSDVTNDFEQVTLTHESQPGSYIARNKGLSLAKGDVIAFTDADCIPTPTWLENGVAVLLSEPNVGLVAGHIDLFAEDANNPNPYELYEIIALGFPQDQFLENGQFGVTANLFTFSHVIKAVGDFDKTLKSGGDKQWGQRVFNTGYRQLYAKDACVKHPTRNTWDDLYKRCTRIMGGRYDAIKTGKTTQLALLIDFISFLKPPVRFFIRTWQDKRLRTPRQKIQFTTVMLRLRGAAIKERMRLQFGGGISERG